MSIYDFVLLCTQDEYKIILSDMAAEDPMPDAEMTVEEARKATTPRFTWSCKHGIMPTTGG